MESEYVICIQTCVRSSWHELNGYNSGTPSRAAHSTRLTCPPNIPVLVVAPNGELACAWRNMGLLSAPGVSKLHGCTTMTLLAKQAAECTGSHLTKAHLCLTKWGGWSCCSKRRLGCLSLPKSCKHRHLCIVVHLCMGGKSMVASIYGLSIL